MIGLMINEIEQKELEYVIKRELDEILFDLQDDRLDHLVKRAMNERYKILFNLFKRFASEHECLIYTRSTPMNKKKGNKEI
ncbi:hypothetical protein [Peribacillus asahii]|uniref:hypothetical protein n=1 Tax=Peribacillus asahii TaxID=228899 RepID=UPI002079CC14|nr:hypothetical protein [Peribacillus asahii]USK60028.1 hypothetical protein LIT37_00930 [Peribacillus asahii]